MNQHRILLLGTNSYVANGLYSRLKSSGHFVNCFSRGQVKREGDFVTGDVYQLSENNYLIENYDTVINFIVIKDEDVEKNIEYIKSVVEFCRIHGVKKLIHFSSIMVYDYQVSEANEKTPAEPLKSTAKKGYGEFKIAVDEYLDSERKNLPFEIIFVRPGYVLAGNRKCPFMKELPFRITLIKGNRNSKQPIVKRDDVHDALIRIVESSSNIPVYHFFPNDGMTKLRYAKQNAGGLIITLPKWIFRGIPLILSKAGIIPKSLYSRFEGMYIETRFNSDLTEKTLHFKFR